MLLGYGHCPANIGNIQQRIGRCLYKNPFGIGAYGFSDIVQVGRIHIGRFQTKFGENILHNTEGAPIDIQTKNKVISRFKNGKKRGRSRHAWGKTKPMSATFQLGNQGFKFLASRVGDATVLKLLSHSKLIKWEGRGHIDTATPLLIGVTYIANPMYSSGFKFHTIAI